MCKPVSPNRYQVFVDVTGDDVTIDKEVMNNYELDRLKKKLMARLITRKFLKSKAVVKAISKKNPCILIDAYSFTIDCQYRKLYLY